jgi:hypothetical protein
MRFSLTTRGHLLAAIALAVLAAPASAQTPTNTWTNSAGTGTLNWSDATNWNSAPLAGGNPTSILQFNAVDPANYTANNDLAGTFSLQGLLFNSSSTGTITLSGNALSFPTTGALINQLGTGAVAINGPLTLTNTSSGNDVVIGGPGSGTITFNGLISGSGGLNVTNYGGVTVVLSNAGNAFGTAGLTGGAQVSAPGATLKVTATSGTPLGSAGVEISAGTLAITPAGSGGERSNQSEYGRQHREQFRPELRRHPAARSGG